MTGKNILAGKDEGATLRVVTDTVRVLAAGSDTGEAYEVFEFTGPRDSGPPTHQHPWNEAYVIIDGEVEMTVADRKMLATAVCFVNARCELPATCFNFRKMLATAVCFVNAPAGEWHAYRIASKSARFILNSEPGGRRQFLHRA
ncbi:MAG TPA: hypothetical protein VNN73_22725 [Blastocatellia bacterium]|nr:hypothetical protein [Blastocatellia bacterium]